MSKVARRQIAQFYQIAVCGDMSTWTCHYQNVIVTAVTCRGTEFHPFVIIHVRIAGIAAIEYNHFCLWQVLANQFKDVIEIILLCFTEGRYAIEFFIR